jgi:hypothetical protein
VRIARREINAKQPPVQCWSKMSRKGGRTDVRTMRWIGVCCFNHESTRRHEEFDHDVGDRWRLIYGDKQDPEDTPKRQVTIIFESWRCAHGAIRRRVMILRITATHWTKAEPGGGAERNRRGEGVSVSEVGARSNQK